MCTLILSVVIFCRRLSNGLSREVIIKYTSTWSSVKNIYCHQTIHSMLFIKGFLKFIELGMCKTTFSFHNWLVSGFWMTSWCKESERGPVLGIFKTLFYLCMDVAHSIAVVVRRKCYNCTGTGPTSLHFTEQSISSLSITELKTSSAQWLHVGLETARQYIYLLRIGFKRHKRKIKEI